MTRPSPLTAAEVIDALGLAPNPAGGWFRLVHTCDATVDGGRPAASVITYLLDAAHPVGTLHRMAADSMHYFHQGGPLAVVTVDPEGEVRRVTMGTGIGTGQLLQVLVPGGWWKGFELLDGPWALISEAVAPAWVPEDHEDADATTFAGSDLGADLERFIA